MRAVARDAVPHVVHAVSAALLTGDPRTVSETAHWMASVLASRGVDSTTGVDLVRRHFSAAA